MSALPVTLHMLYIQNIHQPNTWVITHPHSSAIYLSSRPRDRPLQIDVINWLFKPMIVINRAKTFTICHLQAFCSNDTKRRYETSIRKTISFEVLAPTEHQALLPVQTSTNPLLIYSCVHNANGRCDRNIRSTSPEPRPDASYVLN